MKELRSVRKKEWWETWWGQAILLIVTGVIVGLVVWGVTRHYDKPIAIIPATNLPEVPAGRTEAKTQETAKPLAQPQRGPSKKIAAPSNRAAPQDNSVHVEDGSKIEQQSSGDCSPNIVGGANTVNCGPPSLRLEYSFRTLLDGEQGGFVFDPAKCTVRSHMRIVPNQIVPPPIRVALDFDFPVSEIATTIEGVGATMGGGPFTVGTHAVSSPISPGIGPHNPLIIEVCSAVPIKLTGEPHLVN